MNDPHQTHFHGNVSSPQVSEAQAGVACEAFLAWWIAELVDTFEGWAWQMGEANQD